MVFEKYVTLYFFKINWRWFITNEFLMKKDQNTKGSHPINYKTLGMKKQQSLKCKL